MHTASANSNAQHQPSLNYTALFRRRRVANLLTIVFTYATMYMGRYNLSFVNKTLSVKYNWDKTQVGAIISAALAIYGLSAFLNGPITDRIGGRKAMLIGSTGTVVFNLLFGLGAYWGYLATNHYLLLYFTTVWSLNSYFQSYSALSIIKVNAGWFQIRERGWFSAIFGIIVQSGRALVYAVGPILVVVLPWQWMFFVPAALIAVMTLLTYFVVRNSPEDCGHPAVDIQDASSGDAQPVSIRYVLRKVFTNPVMITIAIAEFCTGFVRHGFEQWFPRYMAEAHQMQLNSSVFQKGAVSVVLAGIAGAVFAGLISDRQFEGRRPPVAFCGYAIQIISLGIVWKAPSINFILAAFIMNSFAISMVHSMLSGVASMDFGGRKAAATAAGAFDGMQYFGGSFVGIGMGHMLDHFGWGIWSPLMIGFATAGAVLMLILWNARPQVSSADKSVSMGPPAKELAWTVLRMPRPEGPAGARTQLPSAPEPKLSLRK